MSLPTDGFTVKEIVYSTAVNNGHMVSITVTVGAETGDQRTVADEMLPYLESALESFRTDYETGTTGTVPYIERDYNGTLQGSL